jgi:hypothetical protein
MSMISHAGFEPAPDGEVIGAEWCESSGCWCAFIMMNGQRVELGEFATQVEAGHAYDVAARIQVGAGKARAAKGSGPTSGHKATVGVSSNSRTKPAKGKPIVLRRYLDRDAVLVAAKMPIVEAAQIGPNGMTDGMFMKALDGQHVHILEYSDTGNQFMCSLPEDCVHPEHPQCKWAGAPKTAVVPEVLDVIVCCGNNTCAKSALMSANELRWCSRCKVEAYCCRPCQTESWQKHKKQCKKWAFEQRTQESDWEQAKLASKQLAFAAQVSHHTTACKASHQSSRAWCGLPV